jgi:chromosomal replication initiation ATPase DnaA
MRDRALTLLRANARPDPRDGAEARLVEVDLYDLAVAICRKYHVTISGVLCPKRTQALARARHEIWWTIRTQTQLSVTEIGVLFGVDHTTIISGIKLHKGRHGKA